MRAGDERPSRRRAGRSSRRNASPAGAARRTRRAAPRVSRAARAAEHEPVELLHPLLDARALRAALDEELLAEPVAPVHLEHEPAEVAHPRLAPARERSGARGASGRRGGSGAPPAGRRAGGTAERSSTPGSTCGPRPKLGPRSIRRAESNASRLTPRPLERDDDEPLLGHLAHGVCGPSFVLPDALTPP